MFFGSQSFLLSESFHGLGIRTGVDHEPIFEVVFDHAVVGEVDEFEGGREGDDEGVDTVGESEVVGNGELGCVRAGVLFLGIFSLNLV